MYGWIWRSLPGGLPGKLVGCVLLLAAAVALLFLVVFPAVEPLLPLGDVTVDGSVPAGSPTPEALGVRERLPAGPSLPMP